MPTYLNLNGRHPGFGAPPAFWGAHRIDRGVNYGGPPFGGRRAPSGLMQDADELKCPDVYKHIETCIVCKHALKNACYTLNPDEREGFINPNNSSRVFGESSTTSITSVPLESGPMVMIGGFLIIILLIMILFTKNKT